MKAINYIKYFILLAVTFALASCEEEVYKAGEKDSDLCQYFYFPAQEDVATDHMLEPSDQRIIEFKAARKMEFGEISVPVIIDDTTGVFEVDEVYFDDGQVETTFKVRFSGAELGKKYTCTLSVTDPEFVSQYGLENTAVSFSVMIVKWNSLGKGKWRDDLMSNAFSVSKPFLETECDVYERADMPGYYRIDNVYTPEYLGDMMNGSVEYAPSWKDYCFKSSIMLDATDPSKVYFPMSYLGFIMGDYGHALIASDVDEVIGSGQSNGYYGKLENGVVTFPSGGLFLGLYNYGLIYSNTSGKFRFVLPGYEAFDYSVALSATETKDGVIPVTFTLGSDVANVKYYAFEGRVTDVEMISKIEDIKSGKVPASSIKESGTYDFTFNKTAFYTIVACSYDKTGKYQGYGHVTFGYDTKENPMDLDISLGLIVSDKYASSGNTKENSMEFYVYGKDITNAKVGLYKKAYYENYPNVIKQEVSTYLASLGKAQLDSLNNNVYSGVIGNLSQDTEYMLVVFADNGYHQGFFTADARTEGKFNVLDEDYMYYDLPFTPDRKSEEYFGEWDLYSWDIFNTGRVERKYRSKVTIEDNLDDATLADDEHYNYQPEDYDVDFVNVKGMYPKAAKEYGVTDLQHFEFYKGFIYSMLTMMPSATFTDKESGKIKTVYPTNVYYYLYNGSFSPSLEHFAMIGGFVHEDVVALVCNIMDNVQANYIGAGLCYFEKQDWSGNGNIIDEGHGYPILIRPGSELLEENNADTNAAQRSMTVACEEVSFELSKSRRNYVESDRGYIKSTIDNVLSRPHNYMTDVQETEISLECQPAAFSVRKSDSSVKTSFELNARNKTVKL